MAEKNQRYKRSCGEVQRADGKYRYRYTDAGGERQTVYSWKLLETEKVPTLRAVHSIYGNGKVFTPAAFFDKIQIIVSDYKRKKLSERNVKSESHA